MTAQHVLMPAVARMRAGLLDNDQEGCRAFLTRLRIDERDLNLSNEMTSR
jgi:hypothetical protein